MNSPLASSLTSVFLLILVLFAAYLTTRLAGSRMKRLSHSRHMEIIDQIQVAKDRTILLLKVGERIFVVGTTPQGMNSIAEIPASELGDLTEEAPGMLKFGAVWKDLHIKNWTDER
jgi:flagellar protein FliO/FliZ